MLGNFEQSTAFLFGAIPYDQAEKSIETKLRPPLVGDLDASSAVPYRAAALAALGGLAQRQRRSMRAGPHAFAKASFRR